MGATRAILIAALRWIGAAQVTRAQTPAEFYAGKTITLIVGSDAGGGYEPTRARWRAHLGATSSGQSDRDRAEHARRRLAHRGESHLNVAPKDGTVIGADPATAILAAQDRAPAGAITSRQDQLGRQPVRAETRLIVRGTTRR